MSLLAWYHLNGDLHNYGVGDAEPESSMITTTPAYVDGKFGKAISTGAFKWTAEQTNKIFNNKELSIAFWIYPNAETGKSGSWAIFGNDRSGYSRYFTVFLYPTINDLHCSWSGVGGGIWTGKIPSYTWTHVCIVYEKPTSKVYINGVQIATFNGNDLNAETFAYDTEVLRNFSNLYRQDYRIYNHALSQREVKELAKGLCIHYALKGNGTNPNLATNSRTLNNSSGNSGNFTHETIYYDGEPVRRFTCITSSYGPWCSVFDHNGSAVVGKTYTWSMWIRGSKNSTKLVGHERGGRKDCTITTEWKYFQYTWTYTDSGAYAITFYNNWAVGDWLEVKHLKVEEGSVATPYIPHVDEAAYSVISTNSNIEYDLTGYGNNGTHNSTTQSYPDSPRYNTSTYFDENDFINTGTLPGTIVNSGKPFSFSVWVKSLEDNTRGILFSSYSLPSTTDFVAFEIHNRSNNAKAFRFDWKNGAIDHFTDNIFDLNTWVHLACTCDGSTVKVYKDAVLKDTFSVTLLDITPGNTWYLGRDARTGTTAFNGCMSDFRLYATVLSADDIKELYNLPMSIDNNSNLLSREINELDNSGVTKNYGAKTQEFIENTGKYSYTVNGTVTINNGIASNFSSTAWINPTVTMSNTSNLDFYFFNVVPATTRITANHEVLFGSNNANKFKLGINKASWKWQFWNGSAWTQSTMEATVGTAFDLRLSWNGTKYVFYGKKSSDKTWTTLVTFNSTESQLYSNLFLGRNYSNNPEFFSGTLDLNHIYFFENNKLTWCGADAVLGSVKAKIGADYISANQMEEF